MTADVLSLDVAIAEKGVEIFDVLSGLTPEKSLSFVLTDEGVEAIQLAIALTEWGIGGNKPKLKETALECLNQISEVDAGDPVNVNFTEYEVKSMEEVLAVFQKALEQQKDGILEL
jgi:hypothetical protein